MIGSERPTVHVIHLYAHDMNVYGDWGNVLTLTRRLDWRGYDVRLTRYDTGDSLPRDPDIIVGGGGQDSGQEKIQTDLLAIGPQLVDLAEQGVPMLMICGLYQMFGKFFRTAEGRTIRGIGMLDIETSAGPERLIGNIVTHNALGDVVGYENHSGRTFLGDGVRPFATVVRGAGNNGLDATEGAVRKEVIGSYLHGPLLPKNPAVADQLIERAVTRRFGGCSPVAIDDRLAALASRVAARRPR
ncbi:type 1 glutamine amidotransferase [Georgenia sp. SYP-B2076]|uniref:type 1 glutamine amidotransferase n=1 Tax=Georgenia sp. SYP-B2076 TaxID=2495881 RepID=UPI000F8DE7B4|nr:glutamine amidotransferase [Georgenia sp. SYP-B2076]